jgi:rod shape-determining protein MreC
MVAASSISGRLVGVSALFFFFSLFLTAYSARNPELGGLGYRMVDEVVRPIQMLHQGVFSSVSNLWTDYVSLRQVRQQNKLLLERAQALESRNSALLEYEFENKSLRDLLAMKESRQLEGQVATVIGYDPSSWQRAIVVDKGSADGVTVGMAVVSGSGLVGQVTNVGRGSSRVLLITDPLSGVDALIQGNRARGIIEGNGYGACAWKFVLREEDVKIGDRVISSGLDGVYPRGLLIGVVTEVSSRPDSMFHDLVVRPGVDMEKIESVYLVSSQHGEGL